MATVLIALLAGLLAGAANYAGQASGIRRGRASLEKPLRELVDGWAGSGPGLAAAVRELLDRK